MKYRLTIWREQKIIKHLLGKISRCYDALYAAKQAQDVEHTYQLEGVIGGYEKAVTLHQRNVRELKAGHFPNSLYPD